MSVTSVPADVNLVVDGLLAINGSLLDDNQHAFAAYIQRVGVRSTAHLEEDGVTHPVRRWYAELAYQYRECYGDWGTLKNGIVFWLNRAPQIVL